MLNARELGFIGSIQKQLALHEFLNPRMSLDEKDQINAIHLCCALLRKSKTREEAERRYTLLEGEVRAWLNVLAQPSVAAPSVAKKSHNACV